MQHCVSRQEVRDELDIHQKGVTGQDATSTRWNSDVQPFSSPDPHKAMTEVLRHTKTWIISAADLTPKIGVILTHSHWTAIVVLAIVIFSFANLREKRSVPLTK